MAEDTLNFLKSVFEAEQALLSERTNRWSAMRGFT